MVLTAGQDIYGKYENFTNTKLRRILDLIDGYVKNESYTIYEIRQDNVNDPYGRVDIEIGYKNNADTIIRQKLLILNDELIDGNEFHKRYNMWY